MKSIVIILFIAWGNIYLLKAQEIKDEVYKPGDPPTYKLRYKSGDPLVRKGHWSFALKAGEFLVQDGVLYEKGAVDESPLYFIGVAEQPNQELINDFLRLDEMNGSERAKTRDKMMEWYVQSNYSDLNPKDMNQLLQLYRGTRDERNKILKEVGITDVEKASRAQMEAYQKEMSKMLAGFVVSERNIFDKYPKASLIRYRKALKPLGGVLDGKTRMALQDDLFNFISGKYIGKPESPSKENMPRKEEVFDFDPKIRYYETSGSRIGSISIEKIILPEKPLISPFNKKCTRAGSEVVFRANEPVIIGHEGRVFVAEHTASFGPFETDSYHTSIVGGLWDIVQVRETSYTRTCKAQGETPIIGNPTTQISTQSQFNSWKVATGAASTYDIGDELTKFYVFGGEGTSPDEILKKLRGVTADKNGHRCRTRYGAFPEGGYGVDWVCHQAANAFTLKKWNKLPVHYSVSYVHWGDYGDMTDVTAPCQCHFERANHACSPGGPGTGCCKNYCYGFCKGWGYGLSTGWHPTKGWIDTEAIFNSHPVPFAGPDGSVTIVTTDGLSVTTLPEWWSRVPEIP